MKAARLVPRILIACVVAWGLTPPTFGIGEEFRGSVITTRRVAHVDSSSVATLYTGFGTLVLFDSPIEGTHFLLDDGNLRAAGGRWVSVTEYIGYLRAPRQVGRCYYATLDAFYPTAPLFIAISPTVCFHEHTSDCGHCGPGTGNLCDLDTEEIPE